MDEALEATVIALAAGVRRLQPCRWATVSWHLLPRGTEDGAHPRLAVVVCYAPHRFGLTIRGEWVKLTGGLAGRVSLACAVILVAMAASLTASQLRLQPKAVRTTAALDGSPRASEALRVSVPAQSPWEKRWWIDKTAKLLRAGEGIGPDDDLEALLKMSEEEIARHFMNDPRFADALLDFNMYFMGF